MKTDKRIEDYLHLYIGAEVFGTYNDAIGSKGILTGVTNGGHECEIQFFLEDGINVEEEPEWNETKEVKLILRQLNSMTEEEGKECWRECGGDYATTNPKCALIDYTFHANWSYHKWVIAINWMRKNQFDIDDLIPSGLAIDKTTLK